MKKHGSKYFVSRPLPDPHPIPLNLGWVQKVNSTFSEYGHLAYIIKEFHKCSNVVANIMPNDPPPPTLGMGSTDKLQLFQNMVLLHIKLKRITKCSSMVANIFSRRPLPDPGDEVNRSKLNFFRTWSFCISNIRDLPNAAAW